MWKTNVNNTKILQKGIFWLWNMGYRSENFKNNFLSKKWEQFAFEIFWPLEQSIYAIKNLQYVRCASLCITSVVILICKPTDYGRPDEIVFTAQPKIQSQSQIFRYGQSIFCLPHRPNFPDVLDFCFHWVSVVRVQANQLWVQCAKCPMHAIFDRKL